MIIGGFGNVAFETSDKRILTFSNFRRDIASRYSRSEVIGQKPRTSYVGPGLDTVTFEVQLNVSNGYNPMDYIVEFIKYARDGEAHPLVIGPNTIGVDKWLITAMGTPYKTFGPGGVVISASIELTFEEYVEEA